MLILKPLLLSGILPAAVVLGLLLLIRIGRRKPGDAAVAFAPAIGFFVSFAAALGWPGIPPTEHWKRIAYIAIGSGIIGLVVAIRRLPVALRIAIALGGVAAAAWFVVPTWDDLQGPRLAWVSVTAALIATTWLSLHAESGTRTSLAQFCMFLISLAASGLLMESGNATLAQLAGALSAVVAALWLASLLGLHASQWAWSACPAFLLVTLLMLGKFYDYGNVPDASFLLLASAPVWLAMSAGIGSRVQRKWVAVVLRLLVTVLPIVIMLTLLAISRAGDTAPNELPY